MSVHLVRHVKSAEIDFLTINVDVSTTEILRLGNYGPSLEYTEQHLIKRTFVQYEWNQSKIL